MANDTKLMTLLVEPLEANIKGHILEIMEHKKLEVLVCRVCLLNTFRGADQVADIPANSPISFQHALDMTLICKE